MAEMVAYELPDYADHDFHGGAAGSFFAEGCPLCPPECICEVCFCRSSNVAPDLGHPVCGGCVIGSHSINRRPGHERPEESPEVREAEVEQFILRDFNRRGGDKT